MLAFFGLLAAFGVGAILLDFAAMMNDPTPSQYNSGVTGFGIVCLIVASIGAFCVYVTP